MEDNNLELSNHLQEIIEKNGAGARFVVMTYTKEQFEKVRDTLVKLDYHFVLNITGDTLENIMNALVRENGYKAGWRITVVNEEGWAGEVSYNASLEHWKEYVSDILSYGKDGRLHFVDE